MSATLAQTSRVGRDNQREYSALITASMASTIHRNVFTVSSPLSCMYVNWCSQIIGTLRIDTDMRYLGYGDKGERLVAGRGSVISRQNKGPRHTVD